MIHSNSKFISKVDIITQIGMIEPIIESAKAIIGGDCRDIEIIGSFARKTHNKTSTACIDLMIPVNSQEVAQNVLDHFAAIPAPSKNKGFMIEIEIGWGWVGIIPAIRTNIKNSYIFVDYEKNHSFMTNPIMHINYIMNSGRIELIKAIKTNLFDEDIKINSFALEMMIIDALKDFYSYDENESYKKVLECFVQKCSDLELLDPANKQSVLTLGINSDIKERLRIFALKYLKNF